MPGSLGLGIVLSSRHYIRNSLGRPDEYAEARKAAMEGFFGRLKSEFFHRRDWMGVTAEEFMNKLDERLKHHNERRIKELLGWMRPMQYRLSLEFAA